MHKNTNLQLTESIAARKLRAAMQKSQITTICNNISYHLTETTNSFTGVKLYLFIPLLECSVHAANRKK